MTGEGSGVGVLVSTPTVGPDRVWRHGRWVQAGATRSGWRARPVGAVSVGGVKPGSGGRPRTHAGARAGAPARIGTREVG
ncbi:hypothetical protein JOD54_005844 [Actinokineospora baliensis]|nr:hypothetical protein [Actinokineospora baliensis]